MSSPTTQITQIFSTENLGPRSGHILSNMLRYAPFSDFMTNLRAQSNAFRRDTSNTLPGIQPLYSVAELDRKLKHMLVNPNTRYQTYGLQALRNTINKLHPETVLYFYVVTSPAGFTTVYYNRTLEPIGLLFVSCIEAKEPPPKDEAQAA